MSSTVVVFGGAGYIGRHLVDILLDSGYHVRVFDNFTFGGDDIFDSPHPNLTVIESTICDTNAVSAAVKGADAVILLAALVGHRFDETQTGKMRTVNLLASTVVLDASIEHGVPRFIFASTNSVYGDQSGLFFETSTPSPITLYARLKLRMEERILQTKKKGDFHPTALRLGTCHGLSKRMRFDLAVNTFVRDAIANGEITLISGEQSRAFIHVKDAARSFLSCLEAHENLISGEIFNVSAPEQNLQLNQVVNIIKTIVPEVKVTIIPEEPDLVGFKLSTKKVEKLLDFECACSLEESVTEMVEALREGYFEDPYSLRYLNT